MDQWSMTSMSRINETNGSIIEAKVPCARLCWLPGRGASDACFTCLSARSAFVVYRTILKIIKNKAHWL